MYSYRIEGGYPIRGDIVIQGSKNAVLPIIAASIVNKGITVIKNCPDISDVKNMTEILKKTGCRITYAEHTLVIDAENITETSILCDETTHVRASVLCIGALLARCGHVAIDYPGGCRIGSRPIDYHIMAFERLGAHVDVSEERIICETPVLKGNRIVLPVPSVGATENAILAALGADGDTEIINAAMEPEVYAMCKMIGSMGGIISGYGTRNIRISGRRNLHDIIITVPSDRIAAGTYMCAGAATGGHVCCLMNGTDDAAGQFGGMTDLFRDMGCVVKAGNDYIDITAPGVIRPVPYIKTMPYPGFPTDMQSQIMAVLCKAEGTSIIEETIFENRFRITDQLSAMGADIEVEGNRASVHGHGTLKGAQVEAKELRGGAALLIAGLLAEGTTVLKDEGYIIRGYDDIAGNILSLGGNISFEKT